MTDYSNTIIYKISCKDLNITDTYVGHTTNFEKRLIQHKTICKKVLNNNLKLYKFIREHGGWENWDMIEIAKYNCKDLDEARLKEQDHFLSYNSTLNTNFPLGLGYLNIPCGVKNEPVIFTCDFCDFKTFKQSNYKTHLRTRKHLKLQNNTKISQEKKYICKCGKQYKHHSSLWNHKKHCLTNKGQEISDKNAMLPNNNLTYIDNNFIKDIIKQNQEFKELLMKAIK